MGSRRRLRVMMFAGTALVLTAFVLVAYGTDVFRDAELDTVDSRFAIRGETDPPKDLVVVQIDDKTFNDLKERWPFNRSIHADAIDRLSEGGARAIAYDVQFTEPSDDPDADEALIDAVDRADNVVLATTEVSKDGKSNVFGDEAIVREVGATAGSGLFPNDPGGVLRRVRYDDQGLESFSVATVEAATGKRVSRDGFDDDGTAWIDYHGPPRTIETVSFSDVVEGKTPQGLFKDKIVVVGPSAPSLQDLHPTSTASEDLMSGAEIQASAISTVQRGLPLDPLPGGIDVALIVLLGMVGPATAFRFGSLRGTLIGLAVAALFAIGVQLAFNSGAIVGLVYPMISLVLGVVGALGVSLVVGAIERERVRDLFARFVPESVVADVLKKADQGLRLGGEKRVCTLLFSDIRGFTTFSETRPADEVIAVLNRYLTVMSDVILDNGGTLVSYMGDGIMAVFSAPIDQPDHADRAVAAARAMSGPALREFNEWMRDQGAGDGFRIGVGLNSGEVMAGNVGSERRLEYTTIGDVTNTASRLEGLTKGTPHMVFLADSTRQMLTRSVDDLIHVDDFPIRGRAEKVSVYSIAETSDDGAA